MIRGLIRRALKRWAKKDEVNRAALHITSDDQDMQVSMLGSTTNLGATLVILMLRNRDAYALLRKSVKLVEGVKSGKIDFKKVINGEEEQPQKATA